MRISDKFLVTYTVNAPLVPFDGRMVPERYVSESTCLKMTESPKQTFFYNLLYNKNLYFLMRRLNCSSSDCARALKIFIFGVYLLLI